MTDKIDDEWEANAAGEPMFARPLFETSPEELLDAYDETRRRLEYSNPKRPRHQEKYEAMTVAREAVLAALKAQRS